MLRIMVFALTVLMTSAHADQMHHEFKNPSFSGIGTGAHYLTIENQENTRKNAIQEKIESDADDIEREKQNTTMGKEMFEGPRI